MIKPFLLSAIFLCVFCTKTFSQSDALSFNGTADYVEVVNADQLNIINNLTIEAWVQLDKIDGFNFILSKGYCGISEFGYAFSVADGKVRWAWNPDGNCNYTAMVESSNVVFNVGECHHLAVVHTNTYVKMYVDGIEVPSSLQQGSYSNINQSTEPFRVGIYRGLSGNFMYFMDGKIDEVKVWDAVKTAQQINYSLNNALAGNENNLVLYYDFENLVSGSFINIPNKALGTGSSLDGTSSVTSPLIETSCAILNNLNVNENTIKLENNTLNVFPNPTNSMLNIVFEKEVNDEILSLYDTFGNKLKEYKLNGMHADLDLSEMAAGIYYLKIGSEERKIIKIQ
jgi:hypothetical protein